MTQYVINIGTIPNDGTGDPLRTAFNEVNLNFDQVFAAGPVLSNIQIANNTILTTNTNGNLVLAPNGVGVVQANVNLVPNTSNIRNLGAADRRWSTVYVQYANVSGGLTVADLTATGDVTVGGNLSVTGNVINIGNIITDAKTIQLANTAASANAANGSGITVGANDAIATMLYSSATNSWTFNIGVDTPNIVVNNITSDDSTFVTIQDGLDVQGGITAETLSVSGNITGNYFIGNGSQLTGVSNYANANAVAYGAAGWAGNIVPAANVTYSLGNSSLWWSNLWVANNTIYIGGVALGMTAGNVLTVGGNAVLQNGSDSTISTTGNITTGNVLTGGVVSAAGNVRGANFNTVGLISATGNITGNYFIGNGSQLTGIVSSYGNANVVANLANLGSNPISTTGNVTVGGLIINGNINTLGTQTALLQPTDDLPLSFIASGANGSVTSFWAEDIANLMTSNIAAIYTPLQSTQTVRIVTGSNGGNIAIYDFDPDGMFTAAAVCATGNVYAGNVSASGNITSGNISTGKITLTNGAVIKDTAGNAVAIGLNAGQNSQSNSAVAIGPGAGEISQGFNAVAVGFGAGANTQGSGAVSVGVGAGFITQGDSTVAIGASAGYQAQAVYAVAIGLQAGQTSQAQDAIAIGRDAGQTTQGEIAVAIGHLAGNASQGNAAVAIGASAGQTTQGLHAVAIGTDTGATSQGNRAVAIGYLAGSNAQGTAAVAIGYYAGELNQGNNSIIINATDTALQQTTANTFTVAPVRNDVANIGEVVFYNATSKEITYGNTISVAGNVTGGNLITAGSGGNITLTGGNITGANVVTANTFTGNTAGFAIGYRDIPQISFTGNATIATTDAGKHYYSTLSTGNVLTIANNASQGFQVGAAITIVNQGTGNITVAQGSGVTLYLAGNATSGNRSVATFGMATLIKVATDTWFINGTGVS
jgi:hypothetical protein